MMTKDDILPFLHRNVQLVTEFKFIYHGEIKKITDTSLVIHDRFNEDVTVSLSLIGAIKERFEK